MLCIKLQISGNIKIKNKLFAFLIHTKLYFFSFLLFILTLFFFFLIKSTLAREENLLEMFIVFFVCFYTIGGTDVYIFIQDRGC